MDQQHVSHFFDVGAAGLIVAHFAGALPSVATAGAIIWYGLQIWDWVVKKRAQHHIPRLHTEDDTDV